nr:carboxylesterase 5A [Hymenolepis microstoma]
MKRQEAGEQVTNTETTDYEVLYEKDQSIYPKLSKRTILDVEELLPSRDDWQNWWKDRNKRRLRKLEILWILLVVLICCHLVVILMALIYRAHLQTWLLRHTLPSLHTEDKRGSLFYETDCAVIYPEYTGKEDWYLIDGIPYATLPRKRAYFASPKHINTFAECYLAFWVNVPPSKRQFVNGEVRFLGKTSNSSCIQLGREGVNESSNVANCLTLSFYFNLRNAVNISGIRRRHGSYSPKPIVAYIGGRGLLTHQPKLIPINLIKQLDIFYVIIRYRLGVFGFGDFGTDEYGPNHGVEDVRKALQWIHENALRFGGSPEGLTLIGENSGASIAMQIRNDKFKSPETTSNTTEVRYLVSKFWLHEGTLAVPDVPSDKRPFHSLVLGNIELISKCQKWMLESRIKNVGSSALSTRTLCLEDSVNETNWLSKTPSQWINADKRMQTLPSKREDLGDSLLIADVNVSHVTTPFNFEPIRRMPIVWISSLDNDNPPPLSTISIQGLKFKVKTAFSGIVSVNIKRNFAEELVKSYEPMVNQLKLSLQKTKFSPIVNAIIDDIRVECLIYAYLRRRARFQKSERDVIYRIISEIKPPKLIEKATNREYDIPPFLSGESGKGYPTDILLEAFADFIKSGRISGMRELKMPQKLGDPDVDTTVNVLGPIGLTTPTARITSHFAACRKWIDDHEDTELALKYSRLN